MSSKVTNSADAQVAQAQMWRRDLQMIFFPSKKSTRKQVEDVKRAEELFELVEACNEITPEHLQQAKIHKVMKQIASTPNIPYDDVYKFSARAQGLLDKWHGTVTRTDTDIPSSSSEPSTQPHTPTASGAVVCVQENATSLGLSKRTSKVRQWRFKLQQIFFPGDQVAHTINNIEEAEQCFKMVEAYDEITTQELEYSKIGKVMRRIASAETIPHDDEFHFTARAQALVTKWRAMVSASEPKASPPPAAEGHGIRIESVVISTQRLTLNEKTHTLDLATVLSDSRHSIDCEADWLLLESPTVRCEEPIVPTTEWLPSRVSKYVWSYLA